MAQNEKKGVKKVSAIEKRIAEKLAERQEEKGGLYTCLIDNEKFDKTAHLLRPDCVGIYTKVIVDQLISHPCHLPPGDI